MSDVSRGAGWWQASDGKWYPPEVHPGYRSPVPPAQFPPSSPSRQWAPSPDPTSRSDRPPFSLDFTRLPQSERISAIATLALFVSLFLPWFTYSLGFGSLSLNGLWHGWTYLVLILCLAILAHFVLRSGFDELPFRLPMPERQLLLIATSANVVLSILAFALKPGGYGVNDMSWGFGAFVGLVASIVAAVPLALPAFTARNR